MLQNKRFGSIGNSCSLIKTVFVRQKWLSRLLHTLALCRERTISTAEKLWKVPGNCAIHTVLDNQESSKRAFHVRELKRTCIYDRGHLQWPQTTSVRKTRWWSGAARGRNFRKLIGSFTLPFVVSLIWKHLLEQTPTSSDHQDLIHLREKFP